MNPRNKMATPTKYTLNYDTPCDVEAGCGADGCNKPEFTPREQVFCQDIHVLGASDLGTTNVRPAVIGVGGRRFVPKIIQADSGTHLVLAAY
jgi:hypothetical protein